jgi:hypothetical protein
VLERSDALLDYVRWSLSFLVVWLRLQTPCFNNRSVQVTNENSIWNGTMPRLPMKHTRLEEFDLERFVPAVEVRQYAKAINETCLLGVIRFGMVSFLPKRSCNMPRLSTKLSRLESFDLP